MQEWSKVFNHKSDQKWVIARARNTQECNSSVESRGPLQNSIRIHVYSVHVGYTHKIRETLITSFYTYNKRDSYYFILRVNGKGNKSLLYILLHIYIYILCLILPSMYILRIHIVCVCVCVYSPRIYV